MIEIDGGGLAVGLRKGEAAGGVAVLSGDAAERVMASKGGCSRSSRASSLISKDNDVETSDVELSLVGDRGEREMLFELLIGEQLGDHSQNGGGRGLTGFGRRRDRDSQVLGAVSAMQTGEVSREGLAQLGMALGMSTGRGSPEGKNRLLPVKGQRIEL